MLLFAPYGRATKRRIPSPCTNAAGQVDRIMCNENSAWIAQGAVSNVTHHRDGQPRNSDFAEVAFTVRRWEGNSIIAPEEMRFTVG